MNKVLITLTNARSGTVFLYHIFRKAYGDRVYCHHETLSHRKAKFRRFFHCIENVRQIEALNDSVISKFVKEIKISAEQKPVLIFGNSLSHLAPVFEREFCGQLRFLFLHREVLETSASVYVQTNPEWWYNIPPYETDYYGNKLTPWDPHIRMPRFISEWERMNRFQKIVYNTLERTQSHLEIVELYDKIPTIWLKALDMFSNRDRLLEISEIMDLPHVDFKVIDVPKNSTWTRNIERDPIDLSWVDGPLSWPELREISERLDHSVRREKVELKLKKFLLPRGLGSRLRHWSGFWQRRASLARFLRRIGLLAERPPALGEDP